MIRPRRMQTLAAACAGCLLASSVAFAQQQERRDQAGQRAAAQYEQTDPTAELPKAIQELDLSEEQKQKIKEALTEHNQKFVETWVKFHKAHARAIQMEAAWVAAVRDTLSEEDQQRYDQQRMQEQELTRFTAPEEAARDQQAPPRDRPEQAERQRLRDERRERREQREQEQRAARAERRQTGRPALEEGENQRLSFVVITLISPERFAEGAQQTEEQQQRCDEACREYRQQMVSLWRELHQLHCELVSIEADRLQAIEEHLTDEQLTKLKERRRQPEQEARTETSGERAR